tara:strand:- start:2802 stop:3947 length:1146 start_codon:yes stop_codon:yes gene_type:complete
MARKSKKRTRSKRGGKKYLGINQKGFQYINHLKDFDLQLTDGKHSLENYNNCAKKFTEAMNDPANIKKFTEAIDKPEHEMYLEANEFFKMKKYWKVMDGNKLEDYQLKKPIGWTMKPLENLRHLLSQSGGWLPKFAKKKSTTTTTNTNKLTPEQEEKIFLQVEYDSLFLPPEKNPIFQLQFSDGQYKYLRAKFSHGLWRKKAASFDTLNPNDLLIKKDGIWRYDEESSDGFKGRIGPAQICKPKNVMSIGTNVGKGALSIGRSLSGRWGKKGGQKLVTDCQWGYRCRKDTHGNNKCLPMIKPDAGSGYHKKILWNPEMPHTSMLELHLLRREHLNPFDTSSQWDDTGGGKKRRKSRKKRRKSRKKRKSRRKRKRSRRRRRR